jgi:hypothetical protein
MRKEDWICSHCGIDTVSGPIETRKLDGVFRQLCPVCCFDLFGEGKVVKCRECGERKAVNYVRAEELIAEQLCFTCHFWLDYVKQKDDLAVARIDGAHYVVCPENEQGVRGFGGRKFAIEFFDGRHVETANLWHQGEIPIRFRERLPDNAKFAS